jgi:hypothetical protein
MIEVAQVIGYTATVKMKPRHSVILIEFEFLNVFVCCFPTLYVPLSFLSAEPFSYLL